MMLALLFAPVYGWSASAAAPNEAANAGANSVPAADQAPAAQAADIRETEVQFPIVRTFGGMGLVLCFMIAAFFAAKKFAPRYFKKSTSERNLKIIETLGMGDRRSISLVEVGNNRFLIGNTPHQINLLAALPEPMSLVSEPEAMALTAQNTPRKEQRTSFKNMFEVEKGRPPKYAGNPLPEDLRTKMRQLRDALERP
jgi:flagellar biosynthetic protein FliO